MQRRLIKKGISEVQEMRYLGTKYYLLEPSKLAKYIRLR